MNEEPLYIDSDLSPCPRCGSGVEWSCCRDLNIRQSYINCPNCDLITFSVESMAFTNHKNLDYETSKMKYNAWVATNPVQYCEEFWDGESK